MADIISGATGTQNTNQSRIVSPLARKKRKRKSEPYWPEKLKSKKRR